MTFSKARTIKSDLILLLTAAIWGFAFVAQRAGTEFLGPFIFNGIRFAIGSLWLLPFILLKKRTKASVKSAGIKRSFGKSVILLGAVLFIAASFQQIGVAYTTAGKAGFITGLYVIIVPFLAILLRKKTGLLTWVSAALALTGLYLLSMNGHWILQKGDLLVLISAFFWAIHVMVIDYQVDRWEPLFLAFWQFLICSLLSLSFGFIFETYQWEAIYQAAIPILYTGLFSVGIGYTLQIVAQREAHPAHAAIIMSLEGVFAVIGGWIILAELLMMRELLGCLLMLVGMLLSQIHFIRKKPAG
ncbi:MAG: DMT family transporter [bacterium]|nr:MAG: DMT family transporter [bacterium]